MWRRAASAICAAPTSTAASCAAPTAPQSRRGGSHEPGRHLALGRHSQRPTVDAARRPAGRLPPRVAVLLARVGRPPLQCGFYFVRASFLSRVCPFFFFSFFSFFFKK